MHAPGDVFRALADPNRRALFEHLARGEAPVKELTAQLSISQPAVSQHLSALRAAGLVGERRDGRLVYYRLEPDGLLPLVDWLSHYRSFWPQRLGKLRALLEAMDDGAGSAASSSAPFTPAIDPTSPIPSLSPRRRARRSR